MRYLDFADPYTKRVLPDDYISPPWDAGGAISSTGSGAISTCDMPNPVIIRRLGGGDPGLTEDLLIPAYFKPNNRYALRIANASTAATDAFDLIGEEEVAYTASSRAYQAPDASTESRIRLTGSGTINTDSGFGTGANGSGWLVGQNPYCWMVFQPQGTLTSIRVCAGLVLATAAADIMASDTVFNVGVGAAMFSYSTARGDAAWQGMTIDGAGNASTVNTLIPYSAVHHSFEIKFTTGGTQVEFYIDKVMVGSLGASVPPATYVLHPFLRWRNLAASARVMEVAEFYVESQIDP